MWDVNFYFKFSCFKERLFFLLLVNILCGAEIMNVNKTLYKVAVYGAVFTASSGFFFYWKIQDNIKTSEYFVNAMKILRNHKPSVFLLGEPIKEGRLDLDDREKNFCDGLQAKFKVPVKGPKQKGTLYFYSVRNVSEGRWETKTMELELANDPSKRLRILRMPEGET